MAASEEHPLEGILQDWEGAFDDFNQSDVTYLDYHIYRLKAAEERLNLTIREIKLKMGFPVHEPVNSAAAAPPAAAAERVDDPEPPPAPPTTQT